jgi:aspartyl-tRNA(Asn)/glutamyl-tRNA(Gln) amidotransferase subunit C
LARLQLTEEEGERYSHQLSSVVAYIEQIQKVKTNPAVVQGVTRMVNVLAEDEPRQTGDLAEVERARVLGEAPLHDHRFFFVRAVLGEENGGEA